MATSSGVTSSLPIAKLINTGTTASGTSSSNSSTSTASDSAITSQLGPSAFLSLLTTQLANQDPLTPMDDTQSVSQLAQFSALQASDNLQSSFANFQSNFAVLQSAGLVGKSVTVNSTDASGNTSSISGTVAYVSVVNGAPQVSLTDSSGNVISDSSGKPLQFPTSSITAIQ
jgi:flagellar basal-body rod modification protein FlgD